MTLQAQQLAWSSCFIMSISALRQARGQREGERERELACTARRQAQSSSLGISFFGQLLICVLSPWNVGCATKLQGSRRMQLTSPGQ